MTSIVRNKANVKMGKIGLATDSAVARRMLPLRLSLRSPKDSMTAGADRLDRYLKRRKRSRSQNSVLALLWRILTAKREIIKVLLRFLERIFNQIVDNTSKSALYPVNAYEKTRPIYLKRGRWRAGHKPSSVPRLSWTPDTTAGLGATAADRHREGPEGLALS